MRFDQWHWARISDDDIARAEELVGVTFDEARRSVLRNNSSVDIQASPGSGKTTLLVAKLAILASRWPETQRGVCVLSHTNVARTEIEEKLVGTPEGRRLLAYPHFIGTIHGFVNTFLGLPELRASDKPVRLIDNEVSGRACLRLLYKLAPNTAPRIALSRRQDGDRIVAGLRYQGAQLTLGSEAEAGLPFGSSTKTFQALSTIKEQVTRNGFFRHDDMLAYGLSLLGKEPRLVSILQHRFPVVLIDEMQDTTELQNSLLNIIFPATGESVIQRFGDMNQAIYESDNTGALAGNFPDPARLSLISNSRRFGEWIGKVANPMGCSHQSAVLIGEGPSRALCPADGSQMPHTVYLFNGLPKDKVVVEFGKLLLETFSEDVLRRGDFRLIGRTGSRSNDDENHSGSLAWYWDGYAPGVNRENNRRPTIAGYFHLSRHALNIDEGSAKEPVEIVAQGIVDLLRRIDGSVVPYRKIWHYWLKASIAGDDSALKLYQKLLWKYAIRGAVLTETDHPKLLAVLRKILQPIIHDQWIDAENSFVTWSNDEIVQGAVEPKDLSPTNTYRVTHDSRSVDIKFGTINSAKGQTHTATLVVDTMFHSYDLAKVKPWLLGSRSGLGAGDTAQLAGRLRLNYVAMTRPTHLLCLAMRREDIDSTEEQKLIDRGWRVRTI